MPRPFIPVPSVARVEVVFSQAGGVIENVFHVKNLGGDWNLGNLPALLDGFIAWLNPHWAQMAAGDCQVLRVTGQDISAPGSFFWVTVPTSPITGTALGNPQPRNVTSAMKWDTGFAGRSYRGRTFHVGLATNFLNTGNHSQLSSAGRDALIERYQLLQPSIDSHIDGAALVVVSYMRDGAWRDEGLVNTITSVTTDFRVDTMRKRMDAIAP